MDDEILSTLAYFQEQIEEMSLEFQKLKDITYDLYKKNEELKEDNEELKNLVFSDEGEDEAEPGTKGKGYSNLIHLYQEGYHICHLSFGEKRRGDCLFCLKLIENQIEEK
jgi:regulator of replication initiation timing